MGSSFFAYLSRMKYINRWALMHSARLETLSEHTLEVAIIAHALTVINNVRLGGELEPGRAVLYALYHDSAEIITGDLPTPVKYYNPKMREAYRELEDNAAERLVGMLPEDMRTVYREAMFCGEEAYEKIIKAADKLSALIKCIEESRLGNREFIKAENATREALLRMDMPEISVFIDEFLPAFSLSLDELE